MLFIQSSVSRYLGDFHFLAIANSASMNNGCVWTTEAHLLGSSTPHLSLQLCPNAEAHAWIRSQRESHCPSPSH